MKLSKDFLTVISPYKSLNNVLNQHEIKFANYKPQTIKALD